MSEEFYGFIMIVIFLAIGFCAVIIFMARDEAETKKLLCDLINILEEKSK